MKKLSSLMRVHRKLDRLFEQHQIALVEGRLGDAKKRFQEFASELRAHKADEDRWVLPLYAQKRPHPEGARIEFFEAEHRKIEEFLRQMQKAVNRLHPQKPKTRLDLLKLEFQFLNYFLHHDLREKNALYPHLDRTASEEEIRFILLHAQHATAKATRS